MVRRDTEKADFEFRILQGIDAPDIEAYSSLLFYLLCVIEKEFISGHKQGHHSEVRLFEPRQDVLADVFALPRNVGGNEDVFHAKFSTNPCNIAPAKVGYHTPIICESHRIEF